MLGTAGGKPNRKLLRGIKRIAREAGLNCIQWKGCLDRGEMPDLYLTRLPSLVRDDPTPERVGCPHPDEFPWPFRSETTLSYLAAKR